MEKIEFVIVPSFDDNGKLDGYYAYAPDALDNDGHPYPGHLCGFGYTKNKAMMNLLESMDFVEEFFE